MLKIAYVPRLLSDSDPEKEQSAIYGYYLSHQHLFKHSGIEIHFNGERKDCDVAWIGNRVWEERTRYHGLPLIQELIIDDSWLSTRARKVLRDADVFAITRGAVVRSTHDYNSEEFEGSMHGKMIWDCAPEDFEASPRMPLVPVSQSEIEKMIPAPGFAQILRHIPIYSWAENNPELAKGGGDRPYSCHFAGTLGFTKESITHHRKLAHRCVSTLPGVYTHSTDSRKAQTRLPKNEYLESLRQSKACVSPWGYGESCHRDFEAILSGCVLIKPDSSHVVMYPDLYHPEAKTYVPCRTDFSDLPGLVSDIACNWDDYREIRENAYNMLMQAIKPETAVSRLCDNIKSRYQRYQDTAASLSIKTA